MDIATKLDLLAREIAEASYYGGIESRVMGQWVDFKELCAEHKRLVQELTSAACAEWFRVEQKPSNIETQKAFEIVIENRIPADPLPGMSDMNREIAYSAAQKLRELGYAWDGKQWKEGE